MKNNEAYTRGENKKAGQNVRQHRRRVYYFLILILLLSFFTYKVIQKSDTYNKPETAASEGKKPGSAAVSSRDLLVATTTSLQDSGLLDVLIPVFEKSAGYKVKVIAVGSGEALEMGKRQAADVLLVHAPELEEKFMAEGYGEERREIMSSAFILAGPPADPAGIKGKTFPEAFRHIAAEQQPFVSRADNSGTHNLEKRIWKEIGLEPHGSWYIEAGQGMGECLLIASEKRAYILSDFPTFYKMSKKGRLELAVLTSDDHYKNIYSVITLKNPGGRLNEAGARAFSDFLVSPAAQQLIRDFGREPGSLTTDQNEAEFPGLFTPLRLNSQSQPD
jgi:tungstate transport system substrate-binding protein